MSQKLRNFFQIITSARNRFVKFDKPVQSIFKDLFDSSAFMLESDDRAEESSQGLVKLASDTNSSNLNSTRDADKFNKTVQPHQLPKIIHAGGINQLIVTSTNETTGRTKPDGSPGSGKEYLINAQHTTVPNSTPVPWLIINQLAPGSEVDLEFDEAAFETSLTNSTTITNIINTQIKGNTSEMKMYIGIKPGDVNSQFSANGAGRNNAIAGADGSWVGWEICDAGTIIGPGGGTRPNMKQNVPVGLDTADAAYDDVAKTLGVKDVTLLGAESGLPAHLHDLDSAGNAVVDGGAHKHATQGTANAAGFYKGHNVVNGSSAITGQAAEDPYQGSGNDEPQELFYTYEEGASAAYNGTDINNGVVITSPGHDHDISGNTESVAAANAASAHENRPPSFVVVYAFFTNVIGQNT